MEIIKRYLQYRHDYTARDNNKENKKNENDNKLKKIEKAKAAIKKSAAAIAAADNDKLEDNAAEKALVEAEGIVLEIERQFGKQC